MDNICPRCGRVIFEELYRGTVSPDLCYCEPVRIWRTYATETWHYREPPRKTEDYDCYGWLR